MSRVATRWIASLLLVLGSALVPCDVLAQTATAPALVVCGAALGERQTCAADTSKGVSISKVLGTSPCEFGVTWGFFDDGIWVRDGCRAEFSAPGGTDAPREWGTYTPGGGFKIANTAAGDLNFRVMAYVRYLNQRGLEDSYTDSFGVVRPVQQRQDMQFNKVSLNVLGWLMSPRFRYLAYVWTQNTAQGQGAQVIVAGNLTYAFSSHFTLGVGVNSLPGTRTTEGSYPFWPSMDSRLITDSYFMPSYTTGIFARGDIVKGLTYRGMIGNNLSQLGVDAGQLGNDMNTFSGELVWMPTTGEYGPGNNRYGDFEEHEEVATRLGVHYTRSDEDRQSQPGTEAIENAQIRISDGNIVFTPRLFGDDIAITDVVLRMIAVDAGMKYRGLALEGEYYWRTVDDLRGPGVELLPFDKFSDSGFQLLASAMVMPKTLEVYASGSKLFGEYGNPSDARLGANWYPWKNREVWWNNELLYLAAPHSPVGALSLPYSVGAKGPIFSSNFMVNF